MGFYEVVRDTINHSLCSQPSSEENARAYDKKHQLAYDKASTTYIPESDKGKKYKSCNYWSELHGFL